LTPETIEHLIDGVGHTTSTKAIQILSLLMVATPRRKRATATYDLEDSVHPDVYSTVGMGFSLQHVLSQHCAQSPLHSRSRAFECVASPSDSASRNTASAPAATASPSD
jgi:hypothetical protein